MARDLYGEMLSRALNRGAPPGHFPAYINPDEAAQLRAQGGGVPPGDHRGQYVVNGLPSYQSPADWQAAAVSDYGQQGPQLESPPTYTMPDSDFTFTQPDVRDEFARQRDLAVAREAYREQATSPPPIGGQPGPPPLPQISEAARFELERGGTGEVLPYALPGAYGNAAPVTTPEYSEELPWRGPKLEVAESAQRKALEQNAKDQIKQNAAVAKVEASYNYNPGTPEAEADRIRAMNANRLTHSNAELSALNFEVIINDGRLTPEEMASRLSANISEGGIGKYAPAAGAARRGVDRGYGDDPNLKPILRNLTRLTPEGEYAVMGGGVSMPRELMSFIPALAGSAATAILPPAIGGLAALGMWGAGGPGLTRWAEAKYGPWDNPLANFLLMRRGPGERVLPEIEDTQRLRRQPDFSQPYGGAPDVPIAEPPFAPPQSVTDEEDVVEEVVVGDGERTLDPISQAIQDRLRRNRELGEEQRRLAQALIPRQFA